MHTLIFANLGQNTLPFLCALANLVPRISWERGWVLARISQDCTVVLGIHKRSISLEANYVTMHIAYRVAQDVFGV